jgi:hypothetical protein
MIPTREEIKLRVIRIITEHSANPPEINDETDLDSLEFHDPKPQTVIADHKIKNAVRLDKVKGRFIRRVWSKLVNEFRKGNDWMYPNMEKNQSTLDEVCDYIEEGYRYMAEIKQKREDRATQKNNLIEKLKDVRLVEDLNELLWPNEPLKWEEVQKAWLDENICFCSEKYEIMGIKKYLLTPEQEQKFRDINLTISDSLNCRYTQDQEDVIFSIYDEWNDKLGFCRYGRY